MQGNFIRGNFLGQVRYPYVKQLLQAFVLTTTNGAIYMPASTFVKCIAHIVIVARLTYHSALHSHLLSTSSTQIIIISRSYTFGTWA